MNAKVKRVLAVLVCAFVLAQCMTIGAFAADVAPEAVVFVRPEVTEVNANQIGMNYVYANVAVEGEGLNDQPVVVYLIDGDGELVTLGYAPVNANKATVKLGVPDEAPTATYKLVVALNKAAEVKYGEIFYIGVEDVTGFFEAINMTEGDVKAKIDAHYNALAVIEFAADEEGNVALRLSGEDYENLTDDAKEGFAELILNGVNGQYSDSKGAFTAENSEDFVKDAYLIAAYNAGGISNDEMAELIYRFASVIGFDAEDEALYGKINNKDTLAKVVKTIAKEVESVEELAVAFEQAAAVQIVNETHWANLVNVIEANNELFNIDEDEIEKLLDTKKFRNIFCKEFKDTYYSVEDIREAWEDAYEEAWDEYQDSKSGGSSGGGGGGGGAVVSQNTVSTQISTSEKNYDPSVEVLDYYTDMAGYHWSSDAVLNLTKAGIVSGYGDKTFKPANSVTRAEFMKMVVNVFGLADITATSTFSDVDKDAWYYIYVASAEKHGIAQGYGNGLFGVNDPVTRQDAITIVYRAAQIKGLSLEKFKASTDVFSDKSEIAAYATPAVAALYHTGVYLDGSETERTDVFAPTKNASRAYLAVILNQLYIFMNK